MRLTSILRVFFPLKKNSHGIKYAGKNQKPKFIKTTMKYNFVNKLMREEQNKKYLMNPYLSQTEEIIYGSAHPERRIQRNKAFLQNRRKPFYPDRNLEIQFDSCLAKERSWE